LVGLSDIVAQCHLGARGFSGEVVSIKDTDPKIGIVLRGLNGFSRNQDVTLGKVSWLWVFPCNLTDFGRNKSFYAPNKL
jgi:hypothetical protein